MKILPERVRENILFPDTYSGWYGFAVDSIIRLLEKERCDVIFSTSPPETTHAIAKRVKERTGLPWVADMRDLWSEDIFRARTRWGRMLSCCIERHTLKDADAVVTVTDGWSDLVSRSAMIPKERIRVITNGYDEDDYAIPVEPPSKFTITYTGKLRNRYQDPEPFFKALSISISDGSIDRTKIAVKFHVFGYDAADIKGLSERYRLSDVVESPGRIGYPDMVKALLSSNMLLFVGWNGRAGNSWHSAKIFDYIGARRPILFLGDKTSSIARLIECLQCGVAAQSIDEISRGLASCYREFIGNGSVALKYPDDRVLQPYTRRATAGQLAQVFGEVSASAKKVLKI
jgi:hypothetical protein